MVTNMDLFYFCTRWKQYEAYVQALEGKYTDLNCKFELSFLKTCDSFLLDSCYKHRIIGFTEQSFADASSSIY